jgi:hypothetical protein
MMSLNVSPEGRGVADAAYADAVGERSRSHVGCVRGRIENGTNYFEPTDKSSYGNSASFAIETLTAPKD